MAKATLMIRRIHMYLGLFLTPWILMYAASSLVFNHFALVRSWYGGNVNAFEETASFSYAHAFDEGTTVKEAARQILIDFDMDGPHFARGDLQRGPFMVMRQRGFGVTRLRYLPEEEKVIVEEQVANSANVLTRMHIRHGYEQGYASMWLWGIGVEATALSMVFWIVSGVWLWWTIRPARLLGGFFALAGAGIFSVLLFIL